MSIRSQVVCAAAGFILAVCCGQSVLSAAEPETRIIVEQEDIVGIVVRPDGETPVPKMPVRVWNAETQKLTLKTRTDANGVFYIPKQKAGDSLIFVGRVKIDLRMLAREEAELGQNHDIVVVLPHRLLVATLPKGMEVPFGLLAIPPLISP